MSGAAPDDLLGRANQALAEALEGPDNLLRLNQIEPSGTVAEPEPLSSVSIPAAS